MPPDVEALLADLVSGMKHALGPKLLGLWRIQLFNAYYYAREAKKPETLDRFAPDLPEDRLDRLVFSHGWVGVSAGTALAVAVLGFWPGVITAVLHAILYVGVAAPMINGLGHTVGS